MIVGIISGYFNPIHTGHLDYIEGAKKHCDMLYVIVNNDKQVELKGSTKFMPEESRVRITGSLRAVDRVMLSVDDDASVVNSIKKIHELNQYDPFIYGFIFMNGGDRKEGNTPESEFCDNNGISLLYNVGGGKTESSSTLLGNVKTDD